jgi:hypothetical protein
MSVESIVEKIAGPISDEFLAYVAETQDQIDNERAESLRNYKIRERVLKGNESVEMGFDYSHLSGWIWVPGFEPFKVEYHLKEVRVHLCSLGKLHPQGNPLELTFKVFSNKGVTYHAAVLYKFQYRQRKTSAETVSGD